MKKTHDNMKPFERLTAKDIIKNLHVNIAERIFGAVLVFSDKGLTEMLLNRIFQFRAGEMIRTYLPKTMVNFMAYEYFDERTERNAKKLLDMLTIDELYELQSEMILNYENTKSHWKIYVFGDYIYARNKIAKGNHQVKIFKMESK